MNQKHFFSFLSLCLISSLCYCFGWSKSDNQSDEILKVIRESDAHLQRFVLDNGMICLIKEDHSAPVAAVQIWVKTGSIDEQESLGAGLSHALEHMIFKGTESKSSGYISEAIDSAGGRVNAYTSLDRTVFHTALPGVNWKTGFSVLSDAVMHASFPKGEWDKEQKVILREFAMGYDDPERVIDKLLWQTAYTTHPYKIPVIGYENIFRKISRDDIVNYFHRNYVPDNMITVVVGDVNSTEVEKVIRDTFADFHRQPRAPVVLPQEPRQISQRYIRQTGDYKIGRLEYAFHVTSFSDSDTPALDMLAQITGTGKSSRLEKKIKEEMKLAYEISASSYTPKDPGLFSVSASFDPAKEDQLIAAIKSNVNSWQNTTFTICEISKARKMMLSRELSSLTTMSGQANNYAAGEFYAADPKFSETYIRELNNITPKSLQLVAKKYLRTENSTLVVLAPNSSEKSVFKKKEGISTPVPTKITLSNCIPIILREDKKLPFVYICAAFKGGLASENEANNGISTMLSEMLLKGTKKMDGLAISELTESLGGSVSSFSGYSSFGLQAQCLSQDAETFIKLLSSCLSEPEFPEQEMEKQKSIQIAELAEQKERPFFSAQEELRKMMFPDSPYMMYSLGTEKSISSMTRKELLNYYHHYLVTGNAVISIFGNISKQEAQRLAEKYFAKIKDGSAPIIPHCVAKPHLPAHAKRIEPKQQVIFLAGFPGVDVISPLVEPITVLKNALSGLSSNLGSEVREKRGLVYYVGAYQRMGILPGSFVIYAGTRPDAVDEVEKLIKKETTRLVTKGLTKEEFDKARNQIIADYDKSIQDNNTLAMNAALDELYGLGYKHLFDTKKRYEDLTLKQVNMTAKKILDKNKMAISVVLPETKTKGEK